VINCDEVRELYGADAVRLYITFLGPYTRTNRGTTELPASTAFSIGVALGGWW